MVTAINKISDEVCSSRVAHLTTVLLSPVDSPDQPMDEYAKEKKSILKDAPFGKIPLTLYVPFVYCCHSFCLLLMLTATDYIMLPEWLMKFLPSTDAVFVQDDVLLMMRQHPPTKAALDLLEDKSLIPMIMQLYGKL